MKSLLYAHMAVIMACFLLGCGGANDVEPIDKPAEPSVESYFTATVGEQLPGWREGTLDIHSISTGRGEAYFYIFPDGTSMLLDAAGSLMTDEACAAENSSGCLPFRPNGNITSGRVIADYVEHFNPHGKSVDYWLNSHFDGDHIGQYPEKYAATNPAVSLIGRHPVGGFYLHGIREVGTLLNFKKIIDRGYTVPIDLSGQKNISDYIRFLNWTKTANGTVYETAGVGRADQVVMTHNPGAYTGFSIRILCGGGWYWTGSGENIKCNLPIGADGQPDQQKLTNAGSKENIYSVGLMLRFGRFDMFTAGDLQYNGRSTYSWHDSEAPLLPIVKHVEVMKANHHGTSNTNSEELLGVLRPNTVLVSPWREVQPQAATIGRFVKARPDVNIFTTDVHESNKSSLNNYVGNIQAWSGHLAVRVAPTGEYMVYVLDDTDQNYKVKSIHGPYKSE